jgi:galactose-1-phosphate uridylyltransferase
MLSRKYSSYYHTMTDGTVKQTNPFNGTEVWSIPGRGNKPVTNGIPLTAKKISAGTHDPSCIFCQHQYTRIAPEKSRLVKVNDRHETQYYLLPNQIEEHAAEFRRVGNMFEILSMEYWKKNYRYGVPISIDQWRDAYMKHPVGLQHIDAIGRYKLLQSGMTEEQAESILTASRRQAVEGFFGGCHDLIIGRRHYADGATHDSQLCSSGELTPDEHFHYFSFTVDAMRDMLEMNPYIRYISVFQNWLRPAGASVDHLHKQICALDEWGATVTGKVQMALQDPNVFNELGTNLASQHNLVFAQNDHAVALVGIGHRFPTIEIYSKSAAPRPFQQRREELRGFSDLVHACHAALGASRSCNEEWFYTPVDAVYPLPWYIELKWRVNVPAGFEGGTGIHINPVLPSDLRSVITERLYTLQNEGKLGECTVVEGSLNDPRPLQYWRNT